ncbi:MAG: hypothetical protein JNG88_08415 [Phycisphaerales bacterium]|nr:hypothetical protein [Phycisphaerales bacterium]
MARVAGRDLKKESFWREMVCGQSGSGMSVRAWCRRHALTEPAFYWWRRRLAGPGGANATAAFVPVRVTDDAIVGGAVATDGVAAGAGRIEIVLADGRRVHLIGPVDRQALADVLAVLTKNGFAGEAGGNGRIAEAGAC